MTRQEQFNLWLWGILTLVCGAAILALVFLGGCSPAPPPPLPPQKVSALLGCQMSLAKNLSEARTCPEAQVAIDSDPDCHALFPRGLDLDCPEYRNKDAK